MISVPKTAWTVLIVCGLVAADAPARGEIVEEIIAWVNGEIITKSEYEEEEQALMADLYRRFSGDELDKEKEYARKQLLQQMIDRKMLIHHAQALGLDLDAMGENFVEFFKEEQSIENDEEFERLLGQQGMTREELKGILLERYAWRQVIQFQVGQRVAVGDREIEEFYAEHPEEFEIEGKVMLREIVLLAKDEAAKEERRSQAEELRQRAASGEDFGELAKEWSEAGTREDGGLFGPLLREDLSKVLAEAAFHLPVGEISEVMETPYGFHIVQVETRVDDHVKPLEEIRNELRTILEDAKYGTDVTTFLQKVRKESEWCVKPAYQKLLSQPAPTTCERL